MDSLFLSSSVRVRVVRDRSLFRGGGGEGLLILGGGSLFFELKFGGGHFFFNLDLGEGYEFLSLHILRKRQKIFKKPFLKDFCPLRKLVRLFFKLGAYWHL